jgi:AcrR family transcriptional regulator
VHLSCVKMDYTVTTENRVTYHHGNLREALIEAAVQLLSDAGAAALSLRKVAIQAGVSHAAPYHHFKDKEALLAAVCERGFMSMTEAMNKAEGDDPFDHLNAIGHAYLSFARSEPDLYRFMFGSEVPDKHEHPELMACAHGTFGTLVEVVERCVESGQTRDGHPVEMAMQVWAMTHGIASILNNGMHEGPLNKLDSPPDMTALLAAYMTSVTASIRA